DVTDQIRKLDIVNTQEESFYKSLLELMQTPLLYLMNNNIVWASTKWQKQFDYSLSEAKNQTIEILFKSQDDYADFLLAGSKELKKTGHLLYNTELVTKSKKVIESNMVVYPVDKDNLSKGILIFFIDYSFLSEKLSPTNDSLDFYNAVVANSEELVLGIKDNMIFSVNQQTETILQYSIDELIGKDLSLLFQTKEAYKEFINGVNKKFITNSNYTDEITINRHDRFPLIFSARASPVSYQEKKGFILILTPLNELRLLINNLRDEKGELEFYSDQLFHDVKNLCQSAYSQIDISMMRLDDDPTDSYERQRRSLTTISRIAELITNMDKFFKIRRKGYELQPYDINTAIENAKEKIKQKFELRKIDIKHNLIAQKFLTLGNELLEDVFLNILENSLMYDRRREVEINIRAKDSFERDDYWRIEFIFTNPNVSREMRKFIDVGYVRDSRTISGSGFGLTLVKAIVESMNGYLTIQDDLPGNKEQGSLIVFETPKYFP
ncbi:MAG: PAS domain-containing protein, partial [Candidatus Heimdallarchaeota archaeon]